MKNALTLVQLGTVIGAVVLLSAVFTLAPNTATANPAMAQKTGKGCPVCHTAPPALNQAGKKYKQTGKL